MRSDRYNPFYGILALIILIMIAEYTVMSGLLKTKLLLDYSNFKFNEILNEIGKPVRIFFVLFYTMLSIATRGFRLLSPDKTYRSSIKILSAFGFLISTLGLLNIGEVGDVAFWYPIAFIGAFISAPFMVLSLRNWKKPRDNFKVNNDTKKISNPYSFNFKTKRGWINLTNPFRGILVIGSNGSGKSESIAYPIIKQAVEKHYSGIIYDFKYPKLTQQYYHHFNLNHHSCTSLYRVNFDNLNQTHRLNPIKSELMKHSSYAREYAHAIVSNLGSSTYERKDFWNRSSTELLTGVFWFLAKEKPQYCTLPHAVALILSEDDQVLLDVISQNQEVHGMVASMRSALRKGANNQSAGVIGTLQLALASLNTPEIFWVLSGDDFDLHLNNPTGPKMLALGSNPSLKETYAPIIACIITVALKLMNRPNQHHSMMLLDEAPTVYIPKLDTIPATARANKLSTIFIAQDKSQIVKGYGKVETDSLIGNLNYQMYGRLAHLETAEYVSRLMGKEDKVIANNSRNQSRSHYSGGSDSIGSNFTLQERFLLKSQEAMSLQVGEFVGITVETTTPHFRDQIVKEQIPSLSSLPESFGNKDIQENFKRIHKEAQMILEESEKYQQLFPNAI